jgi:hypothetical protein
MKVAVLLRLENAMTAPIGSSSHSVRELSNVVAIMPNRAAQEFCD